MTQYARGRRKEYDVVKRLRARGWLAQRSAGSHGLWDVVAVKPGHAARFVQVKYAKAVGFHASGKEWQDDNTDAVLNLLRVDTPDDFEVWVYRYGVKDPGVWAPAPYGAGFVWEFQGIA